jgi:hypothetical protein
MHCVHSKDNFWTQNISDNPYQTAHDNLPRNPGSNPELNTIAAILSTGPVGISDKVIIQPGKLSGS